MRIHHDGRTDVGRRDNNEDAYVASSDSGLYAVADGMGGYEGGEVASQLALTSLQTYFEMLGADGLGISSDAESSRVACERMALALRIADREIARRAVGGLSKMGTTIASLAVQNGRALIAHVGDSRVYRMRDGLLEQLTRDHSLYSEMEASGFEGLPPRHAFHLSNVITQALGTGPDIQPDVRVEEVLAGDRFLLCTDGLSDVLDEESLAWVMTRPEGAAEALVDLAFERGSNDNITALVVTATE